MAQKDLPSHLESTRVAALRAIQPIRAVDESTKADDQFLFRAQRTDAGRSLPPYYLVYFLLVDLLGFRDLGQSEKVAWSVPIDYEGRAYLIEHRKMGLGIFAHDALAEEQQAGTIAALIKKGVREAEPYFEWLADQAVAESRLNVLNKSASLFNRYEYLLSVYEEKSSEALARDHETHVERKEYPGGVSTTYSMPSFELRRQAKWLALSAIEAFFSWSEHALIHLAILEGKVTTGLQVADLAGAEWQSKFKRALDISEPSTKRLFDELVLIRRQLRNYVAHGSFGKRGEAFTFHSGAGAVPVLLAHQAGRHRFALTGDLEFDEAAAIKVLREFISHLWSGVREPAKAYIQESDLPIVLTMASDGTYTEAMQSKMIMQEFIEYMSYRVDQAANMDW